MQPAPLTGTATNGNLLPIPLDRVTDAARTPHGDSNVQCEFLTLCRRDAARTPHGDKKSGVTQGSV